MYNVRKFLLHPKTIKYPSPFTLNPNDYGLSYPSNRVSTIRLQSDIVEEGTILYDDYQSEEGMLTYSQGFWRMMGEDPNVPVMTFINGRWERT